MRMKDAGSWALEVILVDEGGGAAEELGIDRLPMIVDKENVVIEKTCLIEKRERGKIEERTRRMADNFDAVAGVFSGIVALVPFSGGVEGDDSRFSCPREIRNKFMVVLAGVIEQGEEVLLEPRGTFLNTFNGKRIVGVTANDNELGDPRCDNGTKASFDTIFGHLVTRDGNDGVGLNVADRLRAGDGKVREQADVGDRRRGHKSACLKHGFIVARKRRGRGGVDGRFGI